MLIKYTYFRKLITRITLKWGYRYMEVYLIEIAETKALGSFMNPIRFN